MLHIYVIFMLYKCFCHSKNEENHDSWLFSFSTCSLKNIFDSCLFFILFLPCHNGDSTALSNHCHRLYMHESAVGCAISISWSQMIKFVLESKQIHKNTSKKNLIQSEQHVQDRCMPKNASFHAHSSFHLIVSIRWLQR